MHSGTFDQFDYYFDTIYVIGLTVQNCYNKVNIKVVVHIEHLLLVFCRKLVKKILFIYEIIVQMPCRTIVVCRSI